MDYQLLQGNVIDILQSLPEKSIHTCVTSPPYFGLRDYGLPKTIWSAMSYQPMVGLQAIEVDEWEGCLGLEPTPEMFIGHLVQVFREVWHVLRDDGTCWVNMGDCYNGNSVSTLKPKDLLMIPARLALALQADGWYLRSDIIWSKRNPMPESVTDRPTKSHEYIYLLSKSEKYFYDNVAIQEPYTSTIQPPRDKQSEGYQADYIKGERFSAGARDYYSNGGRNKRTVWDVPVKPFPDTHFATFPPKLIEPCILAGTSAKGCCSKCGTPYERVVDHTPMEIKRSDRGIQLGKYGQTSASGTMVAPSSNITVGWQTTCNCNTDIIPCTVLDPFNGSGTTGVVSMENGLNYIGIDLSEKYIEMSRNRIDEAKTKAEVDLFRILLSS